MQIRDIFILVNTSNLILIPGLGDRKRYIRNLNGDVYLIGASAGGVAALNALAMDNNDRIKAL